MNSAIYAHLMAAAIAINGSASARLQKTGAASQASAKYGLAMLLFVLFDGALLLAAVGYFSWAYLGWWPLLTFFAVAATIGDRLGRLDSQLTTWLVMFGSSLVLAGTEWMLLGS